MYTYELSYTIEGNGPNKAQLKAKLVAVFGKTNVMDFYSKNSQQTLFGIRTDAEFSYVIKKIKAIFTPKTSHQGTEISIHVSKVRIPTYNLSFKNGDWEEPERIGF